MYFCRRMSRILAIDYGRKRTGIAVTDSMQIIANGLTTVPTHELMDFLLKYVAQEKVERIVVGHPKQMNNEDSENMKYIKPFGGRNQCHDYSAILFGIEKNVT